MSDQEPRAMVDMSIISVHLWTDILNASPTNQEIIRANFPNEADAILANSSIPVIYAKLNENGENIYSKTGYVFGEVEVGTSRGKSIVFILDVHLNDGSTIYPVSSEEGVEKAVINLKDFRARRF